MTLDPWSLPKRLAEIEIRKKGDNEGTYPLYFRGKLDNYPIYRVSIDMPVYRLSNGRTIARQLQYIAENDKDLDFFSKDPESIEALQAQDTILRGMVRDEGLYEYFRRPQTIQDEPYVLDENGYIINGNRRICAMRMLLEQDFQKYAKYQYVRIIFLSECNEEDIIKLEAMLQIQPDIKAEYSWIAEALLYKRQMKTFSYDYRVLQNIHGKTKIEIQEKIDMIDYANEYLHSRGKENYYMLVEKHQLAFSQLRKFRPKFRDPQDQEIFKELVFKFLDNPEDSPGRLYQTVKDIADNFEQIKKDLVDEHDLKTSDKKDESEEDEDLTLLKSEINTTDVSTLNLNTEILDLVKKTEKPQEIRNQVVSTISTSKQVKKETKSINAFKRNIQDAYTNLITAKAAFNENSNIEGVITSIENILKIVNEIKGLL